ncbi:MAG: hypothetical protein AB1832_02610 [Pseudomonadota bacterium]
MQELHKASLPAPRLAPAAATTPPRARSTDATVSYVVQTTQHLAATPVPNHFDKWGPSLLALGGVLATLCVKWVLDAKRRTFDVKRKLYLRVADAIHEGGVVFGLFASTEVSLSTISERFGKAIAHLSKAEMVAGDDLLRSLAQLKNFTGKQFGEFAVIRMQLERHMADIKAIAPVLERIEADTQWVLEEQRRINVEGMYDQAGQQRFQRVQAQFDMLQEQRQDFVGKSAKSHSECQAIVLKLADMAAKFASDAIPLRADALLCMRKELDFDFDVDQYQRLQMDMAQKAAEMVQEVARAAEETFASERQSRPGEREAPEALGAPSGKDVSPK